MTVTRDIVQQKVRSALQSLPGSIPSNKPKAVAGGGDEEHMLSSPLKSCPCTQARLESKPFREWVSRIHERTGYLHRKLWEFSYIAQALHERHLLRPGTRGLGFAVGQEPLAALFASYGCQIVATDLPADAAARANWIQTGQHAASLEALNQRQLCPEDLFRQRVSFRPVDMRNIPDDLGTFDFIWSSCALEHLGSLDAGEHFIYDSLRLVRLHGVAVHTTEYNTSSIYRTVRGGETVLYRRRDIRRIGRRLKKLGYTIELDFTPGNLPGDRLIDRPPYKQEVHLKLLLKGHVITSFGLIIHN